MNKLNVAIIALIIIRFTTGCNSIISPLPPTSSPLHINTASSTPTTTMIPYYSPTIVPSKTPTNSPTMYPTINTKTFRLNEWYVDLIFNLAAKDNPKSYIDLDKMEIGDTPQSDLNYDVSGIYASLFPMNGALAISMGATNIKLEKCIEVSNTVTKYIIPEVYSGNHICILSNKNQMFLLTIDGISLPKHTSLYILRLLIKAENQM
jgi:hypothetical protein